MIALLALISAFALGSSACELLADSFGDRQIAQVLDDRPSMRNIVPVNHPIYELVSSRFATGGLEGRPVHWDNTEPISGAEHFCQALCAVRVESGDQYTGRDKWAMLVFELFNLSHAGENAELRRKAVKGEIAKSNFIRESLRLEIDAVRQTQEFLTRHPLPGVDRSVDSFYFRFLSTPSNLDDYILFLDRRRSSLEYDPREYNAETYDSLRPQPKLTIDGG